MIAFLILILLIVGFSCLGIFLTRKFKVIKIYTSKTSTILFLVLLSIFVFFWNFKENGDIPYSIGFVLGYVYLFTTPSAFFAMAIMNKFKNNKNEFWHSWFFSLIPIFIILISQSILGT